MSVEEKSALSETGMTIKQLHHGLSDVFNINVRRVAAAFPADRYEDAEIYFLKGRRLVDEYNKAAEARNGFGATVGRGIVSGVKYTAIGIGLVLLLGLSVVLGTSVLPDVGELSSKEKNSLGKSSAYGEEYDRLRRNFAEDVQLALSERKSGTKPKTLDIS